MGEEGGENGLVAVLIWWSSALIDWVLSIVNDRQCGLTVQFGSLEALIEVLVMCFVDATKRGCDDLDVKSLRQPRPDPSKTLQNPSLTLNKP
jgi:hypothetical protein